MLFDVCLLACLLVSYSLVCELVSLFVCWIVLFCFVLICFVLFRCVCLFAYSFACLFICLLVCLLSVYVCICLFVCLVVGLFVCLVRLSVCLFVCLSVCWVVWSAGSLYGLFVDLCQFCFPVCCILRSLACLMDCVCCSLFGSLFVARHSLLVG